MKKKTTLTVGEGGGRRRRRTTVTVDGGCHPCGGGGRRWSTAEGERGRHEEREANGKNERGKRLFIAKSFAGRGPPGLPPFAGIDYVSIAGCNPPALHPSAQVMPAESAGTGPANTSIAGGLCRDYCRQHRFQIFLN